MNLKTVEIDGKTYAEVQDGKPVYLGDDGKEIAFDAVATATNLRSLRGEAQRHREEKEKAQEALKAFEGVDAEAARKALETVANLDNKRLIDAGEVEKVKEGIAKSYDAKIADLDKARGELEAQLHREIVGGSFARSKLIADKFAIPSDLVQARFGQHFKVDGGRLVATDGAGNPIYSKANPSQHADFEEALEVIVGAYPYKDQILKGTGAAGSGAQGGGGGGGAKTIKNSEFQALDAKTRAAKMAEGYQLVD